MNNRTNISYELRRKESLAYMEKNTENYYEKFNNQLSIAVLLPYLVLTFQTFVSQYIALNRIQIVSKLILGVYFLFVFAKYLYKLGGKLFLTILFFGLIFCKQIQTNLLDLFGILTLQY